GVEAIPDPDAAVCAVEQLAAPAPAETAGPGLEVSESAFFRFEQRGDYPAMLRAAVLLQRAGHPKAAAFIERAACAALDRGDVSFAWNALLYLGRLGRA
ncbi:MAG TPA: hypothetical protein PKM94_09475, partial [candidate division Zixibacteria bacterium]|nr:hypothetical protein [candidate division Zixibacteria bacterium]